ncbi:MAG: aldo/keto reductase [Alphaproteobacteria bacterium]|nr:aldo/keto reductase [Alphaproteobacteria bacterium]
MRYNPLGRTGLFVSELCLGTMTFGGEGFFAYMGQVKQDEADALLKASVDAGVNFIDTANVYSQGLSEQITGQAIRNLGLKREDVILATKVMGPMGDGLNSRGNSRGHIMDQVKASLTRLGTDHIDLYQIHWASRGSYNFEGSWTYAPHTQDTADVRDNIADMLEALGDLVKQGKLGHIGVSNETTWGIAQWLAIAEARGLPRLVSVQNEYNLIRRQFDLDMAELSHHEQVGLLAYSPLAGGLLTGKYQNGAIPAGSRADYQKGFWRYNPHSEAATAAYLDLAARHGLDPAQMAIAFTLTRPFTMSTIIGATSTSQLATAIGAADLTLSPALLAEIDAIHRRFPRPI